MKALVEHLLNEATPLKDLNTGKVVVDKKNVEEYIKRLEKGDKTVG